VRPLKFCPVLYEPVGEDLEKCRREYDRVWGNGFVPFLVQSPGVLRQDTDDYLLLSAHYITMALAKAQGRMPEDKRREYIGCCDAMCYLATRGHNVAFTGGRREVLLWKRGNYGNTVTGNTVDAP
jgi:hypothetical protein